MNHTTFHAMGTTVEGWVRDDGRRLRRWFDRVESVCSRFLPHSELSCVNASDVESHRVSTLLADVLRAAGDVRALTAGLVDAGVGSAVVGWGYDRSFEQVSRRNEDPALLPPPSWDIQGRSLWRSTGTRLDLGGVAKGWTCDRAVEDGLALVVSAGGDIRSASEETIVPVLDPWGETVLRVALGRSALATSSVARRRWTVGDREVSHIMDPRTMGPAVTPILSASVVADTATKAEAGAKAVLIHGPEGLAWADEQEWIDSALVIWDDGSVYATAGLELAA